MIVNTVVRHVTLDRSTVRQLCVRWEHDEWSHPLQGKSLINARPEPSAVRLAKTFPLGVRKSANLNGGTGTPPMTELVGVSIVKVTLESHQASLLPQPVAVVASYAKVLITPIGV